MRCAVRACRTAGTEDTEGRAVAFPTGCDAAVDVDVDATSPPPLSQPRSHTAAKTPALRRAQARALLCQLIDTSGGDMSAPVRNYSLQRNQANDLTKSQNATPGPRADGGASDVVCWPSPPSRSSALGVGRSTTGRLLQHLRLAPTSRGTRTTRRCGALERRGSRLDFAGANSGCAQLPSFTGSCEPYVPTRVTPAAAPFNGQSVNSNSLDLASPK